MTLLSKSSVGGGALELEDLAGVVGAVGLLATLADEFVGPGYRTAKSTAKPTTSSSSTQAVAVADGARDGELIRQGGGDRQGERGGSDSAGRALRECLAEKAREFFEGANKVCDFIVMLYSMYDMYLFLRSVLCVNMGYGIRVLLCYYVWATTTAVDLQYAEPI